MRVDDEDEESERCQVRGGVLRIKRRLSASFQSRWVASTKRLRFEVPVKQQNNMRYIFIYIECLSNRVHIQGWCGSGGVDEERMGAEARP